MKASPQPAKRRRYDAAFRAEALRLASESRTTITSACILLLAIRLRTTLINSFFHLVP